MPSSIRIVGTVGAVLALVGAAGVAGGSYLQSTEECETGTAVTVSRPSANESVADGRTVASFDDLSSVEQRLFLEAYTDEYNTSRTYEHWDRSWFHGERVVTYRGERFEVIASVSDCGTPDGLYVTLGGIGIGLVGVGVLGATGAWRTLR